MLYYIYITNISNKCNIYLIIHYAFWAGYNKVLYYE